MVIVGMTVMVFTALPFLLRAALTSFPSLESEVQDLFLVSLAFAVAVIGLAYSWASRRDEEALRRVQVVRPS